MRFSVCCFIPRDIRLLHLSKIWLRFLKFWSYCIYAYYLIFQREPKSNVKATFNQNASWPTMMHLRKSKQSCKKTIWTLLSKSKLVVSGSDGIIDTWYFVQVYRKWGYQLCFVQFRQWSKQPNRKFLNQVESKVRKHKPHIRKSCTSKVKKSVIKSRDSRQKASDVKKSAMPSCESWKLSFKVSRRSPNMWLRRTS